MQTAKAVRPHIRWLIRRDMPEVLAIESAAWEGGWAEEDFLRRLRERNCIGMVAEVGEKVIAYMVYELHKGKLVVLNLAVDPGWRHAGVGRLLVEKLKGKLNSHRRNRVVIDVGGDNLPAQLFLRACGLTAHVIGEDVYRFVYRVQGEYEP